MFDEVLWFWYTCKTTHSPAEAKGDWQLGLSWSHSLLLLNNETISKFEEMTNIQPHIPFCRSIISISCCADNLIISMIISGQNSIHNTSEPVSSASDKGGLYSQCIYSPTIMITVPVRCPILAAERQKMSALIEIKILVSGGLQSVSSWMTEDSLYKPQGRSVHPRYLLNVQHHLLLLFKLIIPLLKMHLYYYHYCCYCCCLEPWPIYWSGLIAESAYMSINDKKLQYRNAKDIFQITTIIL